MAALLFFLTALLAHALQQPLGDPRGERDAGVLRRGLERRHVGRRDPHTEMLLLTRRGGLPALDAICHGRQRIPSASSTRARDRSADTCVVELV